MGSWGLTFVSGNIIDFNPGVSYLVDFGRNQTAIRLTTGRVVSNVPRYVKIHDGWLPSVLHREAACVIKISPGALDQYVWIKHPSKTGIIAQDDTPTVVWQLLSSTDWNKVNGG